MIKEYKLQQYVTANKDVRTINYKTELITRLKKKLKFVRGVLTRVDYYSFDAVQNENGTFKDEDRILQVKMYYKRDSLGRAISRTTVRKYVLNGSSKFGGDVKITHKDYNRTESLQEGIRRRSNIYLVVYELINGLDESSESQKLLKEKTSNYFERHKSNYVNLDIRIDMEEVASLDELFKTTRGKQAVSLLTDILRVPPNDEYTPENIEGV